MRAALYPRVSTEEQHIKGLSLVAQQQALEDYAKSQGYEIVGIYADEGISARKPVSKRPAMLRLLEDVKKDKIDIILVTKLDRWFRNIKEYHLTQEILDAHNCYWKTIFENYDTSTANGQMVVNIMLSVNQSECDRDSERIKAVFDYKRSQGMAVTGMCAPYGYIIENKYVVKDQKTRHIVEDAIDYYFTWFSVRKTHKYLQEKYGAEAPSFNKVDRIFKNPKYWGEWEGNPNYCEPYMTLEQARKMKTVKNARTYEGDGYTYIFSSLIKCPVCGCSMTGYKATKTLYNGHVSVYRRYRCLKKYDKHPSPNITETVVEAYMLEHVVGKLEQEIFKAEQQMKKKKKNPTAALIAERERLNTMFLKGRISDEYYDEQYMKLSNEINKYKDMDEITPASFSRIKQAFSGDWIDIYKRLDNEHKNSFWKNLIKEIHCDKDSHKLCDFTFLI